MGCSYWFMNNTKMDSSWPMKKAATTASKEKGGKCGLLVKIGSIWHYVCSSKYRILDFEFKF